VSDLLRGRGALQSRRRSVPPGGFGIGIGLRLSALEGRVPVGKGKSVLDSIHPLIDLIDPVPFFYKGGGDRPCDCLRVP
tara:strand:- start:20055 stop:20291 length:237 start_codon:yes stop_codon:yes gene_type:complete